MKVISKKVIRKVKWVGGLICIHGFLNIAVAQNVGINTTGTIANASALLDVEATDKGILIPRVSLASTTDVTTIATPATNLLVFNTNASMTNGNGTGFYYYSGSSWTYMVAPANGPGTSGEVLTSQGGGSAPEWASTGGGCLPTEITNELDGSGNPCVGTGCGVSRNLGSCSMDCSNLSYNGNDDWRVPTLDELVNLIPIAPGNTSTANIWTATDYSNSPYVLVNVSNYDRTSDDPSNTTHFCRCVR